MGCIVGCQVKWQLWVVLNSRLYKLIALFSAKILMKQESQSSPDLSEEQKQVALSLNDFWPALSPELAAHTNAQSGYGEGEGGQGSGEKLESEVKVGRRGRRGGDEGKNINRGHWSTQENKKYHWFLQIHYRHFVNRHMRRMDKIFKTMELFIGTRQAQQCRSHHQKMEKKYINFISIVSNLREGHYSTLDIQPMKEELQRLGIQIIDKLATIEQLKSFRQGQQQLQPKLLKKSLSVKSGRVERQKQQKLALDEAEPMQEMNAEGEAGAEEEEEQAEAVLEVQVQEQKDREEGNPINMFDDSHHNIGDISMYHQKEDNSCIFNSIFHSFQ